MSLASKLRRAPGRLTAGGFILNSGLSKLQADEQTAKAVHGMAVTAYPILGKLDPKVFTRGLAVAEIGLGSALLLPIVPPAVAGTGLAAFSGGLLGLYWRTPGMHGDGDPRPSQQGIALAKDIWMAGIAAGLIVDSMLPDQQARREIRRADRRAARAEAKVWAAEAKREDAARRRATRREVRKYARQQAKVFKARAEALQDSAQQTARTHGEGVRAVAATAASRAADAASIAAESARTHAGPALQSTVESARSGWESARSAAAPLAQAAVETARSGLETAAGAAKA